MPLLRKSWSPKRSFFYDQAIDEVITLDQKNGFDRFWLYNVGVVLEINHIWYV
jgi:hypothetical protein